MPYYDTHSEAETHRLGIRLGARLRAGDVVLLSGELGAGKSALARGIARGLGAAGPMPSPTFTLMTRYGTDRGFPLYHLDLYRLEDARGFWESGLEEHLGGDGVALVEWPERALEALPARCLVVTLACPAEGSADARRLRATALGGFPSEAAEGLDAEPGEDTDETRGETVAEGEGSP
jgi:tRNA threonylcarbamoyladenosine biosynthesis protein TsaE